MVHIWTQNNEFIILLLFRVLLLHAWHCTGSFLRFRVPLFEFVVLPITATVIIIILFSFSLLCGIWMLYNTGCSIKKVTKYWAVKPIQNLILRLSNSLKPPKIKDILITSQVFSKGGLKFPFKASRSQIPKYLIFHNTGYKIFT